MGCVTRSRVLSTLLHDETGGRVNLTSRDFHKSLIGNVDTQRQRVDEAWPYLQPTVELIAGAANAADC
jgi:hypothetical protein